MGECGDREGGLVEWAGECDMIVGGHLVLATPREIVEMGEFCQEGQGPD